MANGAWREGKYNGGYEFEVFSKRARRWHSYKPGVIKYTQARFWRRVRRLMRIKLNGGEQGYGWQ